VQKHFVATALLGNWDVVGLHHDNIKVSADGKPYLIDNGGSFDVSATATKKGHAEGKPFGPKVDELATLLDAAKNPQAAGVFKGVTKADVKAQIGNVVAQKQKILDATPAAHKATMEARIEYLKQWAATDGKPNAKKLSHSKHGDVWIAPAFKASLASSSLSSISHPAAAEYLNHITDDEHSAVSGYTGSQFYGKLNELLYTKKGVKGYSHHGLNLEHIDNNLQSAFAKASTLPEPITSTRKIDLHGTDLKKFVETCERSLKSDQPIKWRNYQSTGPSWSGNVKFTIEGITEGAIDVKPISKHTNENEILLNRGTFYKTKSVVKTADGYHITMTQVPAAEAVKGTFMEAALIDPPANPPANPAADSGPDGDPQRELTAEEIAERQRHDAAQIVANLSAADATAQQ
jgi:hypothetical protein